ncbi:Putative glycosyl transferase CAP10 domain-containing protein [Septoria linicola]|uniref:Glycosyl transferase CAP10 domain-containing protein n=1 Tax=Septoria linicola TaxID=215465 RepID=A0A9Q9EE42_9PEZI|nr:putative glycosyl transferase CAP10 domain-containing protein [Septoria linicola]USW48376.1 Putative glycosyl transferase CAP10 domain-containing protein [Septoria linicola]
MTMWGYTAFTGGMSGHSRWNVHPTFWKILCATLALILAFREYSGPAMGFLVRHQVSGSSAQQPFLAVSETYTRPKFAPLSNANSIDLRSWIYNWARDSNNAALSAGQCDLAFPELYHEIDRAKQHFSGKSITEKDIDLSSGNEGGVRILVTESQVRIVETRGLHREDFRHRIIGIVQQVVQAVAAADASGEAIPTIEFTVVVDDMAVLNDGSPGALWAFTRRYADTQQDNVWVAPDFHFFGAPPEAEGFRTMQQKCRKRDSPLKQKIPQVVWRGAVGTNEAVRQPLLDVTAGKSWANVTSIDWFNPDSTIMAMENFCKFRYTVNTEGRSWSARMTHLINCDSLLFVHDVEWIAHYYHLLDTGTNCVHVNRTFENLEEQVDYFNKNLDQAQRIADQTVTFTPRIDIAKDGHRMKKTRGITFEEFTVHKNDEDYPYRRGG